ncbi:MAG TPA: methionyl-tRNA formyltransferase [Xanthobacteraceae bacterium]|nr:methionyl-tRNA formyltransferase [Xanthobacteraceae bacterium]
MALRLVFMGTPEFAVPALDAIVDAGHKLTAVYTRPPRPAGRGMAEQTSPIADAAERLGLEVSTPKTLREIGAVDAMRAPHADAAVVVAYGLILPKEILDLFPLGCFNLHASLLPRWRGAAPIERAIMAGDHEAGVAVMKMEVGLDTGPVAMTERVAIAPDATAGDLHDELARLGAHLMVRALADLEKGALHLRPQPSVGVTYANKIEKAETRIDWTQSCNKVHDHCRGLSPFPGAWFEHSKARRIKVLRTTKASGAGEPGRVLDDDLTVACGEGAIRLIELQREGRKPMCADEFLRGTPIPRGSTLR